jgi:hypothetical protein
MKQAFTATEVKTEKYRSPNSLQNPAPERRPARVNARGLCIIQVVKRCGCDPAIEPRHLVGSLQERLWRIWIPAADKTISNPAQGGGNEQTYSDANGRGGGNSHKAPFTWGQ